MSGDGACSGGIRRRQHRARVATLARRLIASGIGPDDAVLVCMPRSVEMVLAVHAVVAAGGQYVPVAPDAPAAAQGLTTEDPVIPSSASKWALSASRCVSSVATARAVASVSPLSR